MLDKIDEGNHGDADLAAVDLRGPQPCCEGPKLRPFPNRRATIKFIKRLDNQAIEGQSHVFEVLIARKQYALKVVSNILEILPGYDTGR